MTMLTLETYPTKSFPLRKSTAQRSGLHRLFAAAIQGFAATLPEQALKGLVHNPNIEYIEVDQVVVLDATWRQARRMFSRTPALRAIPKLVLPEPDASWTWNIIPEGKGGRSSSKELNVGAWHMHP